jgi:RNA polymerase sigma factor (sigma-70 family)
MGHVSLDLARRRHPAHLGDGGSGAPGHAGSIDPALIVVASVDPRDDEPDDAGVPDLPDPAAGPVVSDGRLHRVTVGGAGPDLLEPPADDPAGPAWPAPTWAEIVEKHSARVFRLAYRLTGNRHDAEDLTQDVFVRVFRALPTFTPGNFDAWIHRITTNLFLDSARRRKRIRFDALDPEAGERLADPAAGPDEQYHLSNLDGDVRRALMALRPEFRAAVVLADIEGLPYDEVADALGIKLGTVRSRIHRGRAQLREQLAHRAPTPRPVTAQDAAAIPVAGPGAPASTIPARGPAPVGGTSGVALST